MLEPNHGAHITREEAQSIVLDKYDQMMHDNDLAEDGVLLEYYEQRRAQLRNQEVTLADIETQAEVIPVCDECRKIIFAIIEEIPPPLDYMDEEEVAEEEISTKEAIDSSIEVYKSSYQDALHEYLEGRRYALEDGVNLHDQRSVKKRFLSAMKRVKELTSDQKKSCNKKIGGEFLEIFCQTGSSDEQNKNLDRELSFRRLCQTMSYNAQNKDLAKELNKERMIARFLNILTSKTRIIGDEELIDGIRKAHQKHRS